MVDAVVSSEIQTIVSERTDTNTVVLSENSPLNIIELEVNKTLVNQETITIIISEGQQGPQGISGVVDEEMPYSKRIDFVSDNLLYRGEAAVGALNSEPVWRVRRISIAVDGDISETWINGNSNFSNIWDNRLLGSYL